MAVDGAASPDPIDVDEAEAQFAYISAALLAGSAEERDAALDEGLIRFGIRLLDMLGLFRSVAKESGGPDTRWVDLLEAAVERLGVWLGGTDLSDRVDEEDRRAAAAHQLIDRDPGGRVLAARLVARTIRRLPAGHPLRDTARARDLLERSVRRIDPAEDPDTLLLTLAELATELCPLDELDDIEDQAGPLFDTAEVDSVTEFRRAMVGRLLLASIGCRNAGDEAGRRAWLDRARPHLTELEACGDPGALLVAAITLDAADEVTDALSFYEVILRHPDVDPIQHRLASYHGGRTAWRTGDDPRALELLSPVVASLRADYVDAIPADEVEELGTRLGRACRILAAIHARSGRWEEASGCIEMTRSARFRARQALRATEAGRQLLAREQLILGLRRGIPVEVPPGEIESIDRLGEQVGSLSAALEAFRTERPEIDPALVAVPTLAEISAVLEPDEVVVLLGLTAEGTLTVALGPTWSGPGGDQPRFAALDTGIDHRGWVELMAGTDDDGWLFALGAPEADLDRPASLDRLLDAVDCRWAAPLVADLGGPPARLTIVPHGVLHLVPFHALASLTESVVMVAPSAADLVRTRRRPVESLGGRALIVSDPTSDLQISDVEATSARRFAAAAGLDVTELRGPAATGEAITRGARSAALVHLSAHGQSNVVDPDDSALLLAPAPGMEDDPFPGWLAAAQDWTATDEERVEALVPGVGLLREQRLLDGDWIVRSMDLPGRSTVWCHERGGRRVLLAERWSAADLSVADTLRQCQLAVLSACESATSGMNIDIDEQSGLPAALGLAGVGTVIATQWPVEQGTAALTIDLLYRELTARRGRVDVAELVDGVRRRLRAMGRDEALGLVAELRRNGTDPMARLLLEAFGRRLERGPDRPFTDPWHWAAFVVTGSATVAIEEGP